MNKICQAKNIEVYVATLAIVVIIVLIVAFGDPSNMQSAHEKEVHLELCQMSDSTHTNVRQFSTKDTPFICGEVTSEYLPLEIRYYLTDLDTGNAILSYEYIKITTRKFAIELPKQLGTGNYKFELKAGGREHVAEVYFTISP